MSSSFCLLGVDSRDFSYAEKERTSCKAEQIHKMTIIILPNGPRLSFCKQFFLSQLEKSQVTQLPTAKN